MKKRKLLTFLLCSFLLGCNNSIISVDQADKLCKDMANYILNNKLENPTKYSLTQKYNRLISVYDNHVTSELTINVDLKNLCHSKRLLEFVSTDYIEQGHYIYKEGDSLIVATNFNNKKEYYIEDIANFDKVVQEVSKRYKNNIDEIVEPYFLNVGPSYYGTVSACDYLTSLYADYPNINYLEKLKKDGYNHKYRFTNTSIDEGYIKSDLSYEYLGKPNEYEEDKFKIISNVEIQNYLVTSFYHYSDDVDDTYTGSSRITYELDIDINYEPTFNKPNLDNYTLITK